MNALLVGGGLEHPELAEGEIEDQPGDGTARNEWQK
jgi:hypothetical protein